MFLRKPIHRRERRGHRDDKKEVSEFFSVSSESSAVIFFIFLVMPFAASPEIIERIAVTVGNQVITTDQINEEIRVTAFLNHSEPKLTTEEKKKAAERLIEQALIRDGMNYSHYPLPTLADAEPMRKLREDEYPGRSAFLEDLARYGITEEQLRQHLWWQITLLKFIDDRFRPAVQVSSAEILQHYREQVQKWREEGLTTIPAFAESRAAMEQALIEDRIDNALSRWLGDARLRVDIRFRDGALQ
jgi:hypothetical protein